MANKQFIPLVLLLMCHHFCVTVCCAETLYLEDFDDPASLNKFNVQASPGTSASISNETVYSGVSSLHVISTNPTNSLWITIPLSIPFEKGISVSFSHYFLEGTPIYWISLLGYTSNLRFMELHLEYGSHGPYWFTNEIVFMGEFEYVIGKWKTVTIDLFAAINTALETPGSPWSEFGITQIERFSLGLNPGNEPYDQRNIFFDNFEIWDLSELKSIFFPIIPKLWIFYGLIAGSIVLTIFIVRFRNKQQLKNS